MKRFKRTLTIVSICLCLSMLLSIAVSAFDNNSSLTMQELDEKYGLQTIPADQVVPGSLSFDSVEEADAFLSELTESLNSSIFVEEYYSTSPLGKSIYRSRGDPFTGTYRTTHHSGPSWSPSAWEIVLMTDVTLINRYTGTGPIDPRGNEILSASSSCVLSGITLGVSLNVQSTNTTIMDNKKKATATSSGSIQGTIFVDGIGKWADVPYSVSHILDAQFFPPPQS